MLSMDQQLENLAPSNARDNLLRFYNTYADKFRVVCAGAKHHHWWIGGLNQHCSEMCERGLSLMRSYPEDFSGKFTEEDVIISVLLHDFPKIFRYRLIEPEERQPESKKYIKGLVPGQVFTYANPEMFRLIDEESWLLSAVVASGYTPPPKIWSAVLFAEGAWSKSMWEFGGPSTLGNGIYARNPLATFVHMLDMWSSQILGRSLVV